MTSSGKVAVIRSPCPSTPYEGHYTQKNEAERGRVWLAQSGLSETAVLRVWVRSPGLRIIHSEWESLGMWPRNLFYTHFRLFPLHNSLKTYAWGESDLFVVNFNLKLFSNVNFGGESVNFKKILCWRITALHRNKTKQNMYFDLHFQSQKNIKFKLFLDPHIKCKTIILLEEDVGE